MENASGASFLDEDGRVAELSRFYEIVIPRRVWRGFTLHTRPGVIFLCFDAVSVCLTTMQSNNWQQWDKYLRTEAPLALMPAASITAWFGRILGVPCKMRNRFPAHHFG